MILALVALCLGVTACHKSSDNDKPVITVSIEPQRWMLEQIVGDKMRVQTLLANGGNPESYEPTFSHLAELERSACYMAVGHLPFESSIIKKVSTNNPGLPIVVVSDSIALISDEHHGHDHGVDPHVWSSAANARIIARNMLRAVKSLDAENAGVYEANARRLMQRIDSVDSLCREILAPVARSSFLVMHPSLSYFARDYDLQQLSIGSEGKEHSVADIRKLIDFMPQADVRAFLVQKDFDSSKAEVLSSGIDIPVISINPLNYNWDNELLHTARAISGQER